MKITFASHAKDSSKSEGQEPWGEILVSGKKVGALLLVSTELGFYHFLY